MLSSLFDEKERQSLYRFACEIADASGKRTAKERRCLQTIADAWAIGTAERNAHRPNGNEPKQNLKLSRFRRKCSLQRLPHATTGKKR